MAATALAVVERRRRELPRPRCVARVDVHVPPVRRHALKHVFGHVCRHGLGLRTATATCV